MEHDHPAAQSLRIFTTVSHRIRTVLARDDLVGWVISGRKTLISPRCDQHFLPGKVFLIPRNTQWDVVNEASPGKHYEARVISFGPALLERFHQRFGQFSARPQLQSCAGTSADPAFASAFEHASIALNDRNGSSAIQEHRALEVLLVLAERGLVFSPPQSLSWGERVYRLIGQRPDAQWTTAQVAQAFHLSNSTLQRRLAEEGTSLGRCVRDVRLETALALLQSSTLAVSEIAARCGYASHSRFSATFRERYGFSPSHLRPATGCVEADSV